MFKLSDIQKVIEAKGLKYYNQSVICATAVTSDAFFYNGIGDVLTYDKNHVIHFGDKGISIIVIDILTGSVIKDDERGYAFIPNEKVENIRVKFGLFKYKLYIDTAEGTITYDVSRSLLMQPWHAKNLSAIIYRAVH